MSLLDLTDPFLHNQTAQLDKNDLDSSVHDLNSYQTENIDVEKELEYYEKSWNDSDSQSADSAQNDEEAKDDEAESDDKTEYQESVIENPSQSFVPGVVEATKKPKTVAQERKERRRRGKKSKKSNPELNSRKIVKEQVTNFSKFVYFIKLTAILFLTPNF